MINLKELRDLIVGQRTNHGVVFAWGLDDERLCSKQGSSLQQNNNLSINRISRPKVIKMPDTEIAVTKVVCGNSYTLVLGENGHVYSWGIGKSGSLGLGELHTIKTVPSRI